MRRVLRWVYYTAFAILFHLFISILICITLQGNVSVGSSIESEKLLLDGMDPQTLIEYLHSEFGYIGNSDNTFPKRSLREFESVALSAFAETIKDYCVDIAIKNLGLSYDGMKRHQEVAYNELLNAPDNDVVNLTVNILDNNK